MLNPKSYLKIYMTAIVLFSVSAAHAEVEPICSKAALVSAVAFRGAGELAYDQRDASTIDVTLPPNILVTMVNSKLVANNQFEETYLVTMENASSVEKVARVTIEAYNKDQGFCVVKKVELPDQEQNKKQSQGDSVVNQANAELSKIKGSKRSLDCSMGKQVSPIADRLTDVFIKTNSSEVREKVRPLAVKLTQFLLSCGQ